jgi:hypothetical protein
VQREVESVIKTVSDAVRLLFASSLVWVCEAIDENLARWARRRVAKQRTQKEEPRRIRPRGGS